MPENSVEEIVQNQPIDGQAQVSAEQPVAANAEEEVSEEEEAKEKLPFPTACIVRLIRAQLDRDKIIKKDVKIGMNKWLGNLVAKVAKDLNKLPYTTIHLHEFRDAIQMYVDLEHFDKEKERILAHMDAIKKDIQRLERDLGKVEESQLIS